MKRGQFMVRSWNESTTRLNNRTLNLVNIHTSKSNMGEHLRDAAELEGALLVEAHAVAEVDSSSAPAARTTTRPATATAAVLTSCSPSHCCEFGNYVAQVAVGIPDYLPEHGIGHQLELEQQHAREGSYRGRVQAEQEIESIQRANWEAVAKAEMERQRVRSANNFAPAKSQWLGLGAFDPPVVETPHSAVVVQQKHDESSVAAKPKTSGRGGAAGYHVSEYTTSQYDTASYETTEYKSVYDP
jgi:hypothetical protein